MSETEAVKEFKEGLSFFRNNYASKAVPHFNRALELDAKNPFYLSYLGLALAAAEKRWEEAEDFCFTALKMKRTQPELYINLSEVYRLAGRKEDAIETLTNGLPMTKKDPRLVKALHKLGIRRPPVLTFLDRNHFLNRQLGKLRYKLMKSTGKEA